MWTNRAIWRRVLRLSNLAVGNMAAAARRPNGIFGKLFGFSMGRINRGANAWTLAKLDLSDTDDM